MPETTGRVLHAGLHLLDRQLVDRNGHLAGKVDDLELRADEDTGNLFVVAILSGPGVLLQRHGSRVLGPWLQRVHRLAWPGGENREPARISMERVSEIGPDLVVAADDHELGSYSVERWFRDHVIAHIPGSRHAPAE